MNAAPRLPVVLLWHMHQPQYRDALTGQYALPWTYLHAIKDYTDMAAHLEGNREARAVVNFSPLLIEQLEELARRIAEHLRSGSALPDPVLALLGPGAVPTEPAARLELLRACLKAQRKQMIERFGPYLELATIAETLGTLERISYASDQFIFDLAVWYHLAWLGETVRRSDPLVARLTERGRDFTSAQRRDLLGLIGELVGQVIPRFRALAERGQCELSVTPYAHPIIPLLLDFHAARDAVPAMALPEHAAYPGGAARAQWHIEEAVRVFTRAFGAAPAGCWPAEGAISAGTLELLAAGGFRWTASGAGVLRASLAMSDAAAAQDRQAFNRPYRLGGTGMSCFFRDDTLSDLIGFTYATWHGDDAAANLVNELEQMAHDYERDANHAVLIALDGENAWEHYPFNGYYFLRALYAQLASHPRLELTTLSACLSRGMQPAPLPRLCAGSWVHGTLATWIGDPAKNRAWDLLCDAKEAYDR
ncbi:MAG TPA: glycoside hydrolase family 57 protein, partial [Steroidobacteraceae bacterium]|nr:glycoside hydrolase family 57 protein [Steroidobacteraceae bacterium]